ncbi:conserved hypothetical protein [Histoplasma capsulatum var. duboisii H88]|uniref:Uncharacterized protein n=1 Tax=Ajellomyces capsulatus (strain H88) TaxID=544711 RepID=F0UNS2_AJEC8|nr:conserved hypothetical protein [Histoplasma capsulatum var. duboisii H88]
MEKAFEFNKQQMLFVRQCFGLPGGWGMLFGPPGTGKTFELIHLITPILANQRMISQDTDETPNRQILIVTSANEPATDIALKLREHNKDKIGHLQRLPMVVRAHSRETEEAVARLWQQPKDKPRSPNSRPPIIPQNILDGQSAEDIDMLDLISMSKVLLDTHSRATKTRFEGIKDPRFRAKDISVGAWMLRRLGLILDEPKEFQGFSHPEKYTDILNGFSLLANGESHATKEDREAFTKGIRELQYDIIRHADVVTTLSNAGTEWIKLNANFDAIFLDEAGQAPEPQVWNALAVHKPRVFIQFGDPRQLPPFCKSSTVRENNFYLVLHTSLFTRLERAGFLHVMLERQHRMNETICKLVSDLSYHGRMITVDSESNYLTSRRVSRFNRKYGKERTAIYLDVAGSKEELNSTKSKANLDHRKIVLELAASLLRENVVLDTFNASNQLWFTCVEPRALLTKYGEYVHGSRSGDRRVVLDAKTLEQIESSQTIRVIPAKDLLERFLATLRSETQIAVRENQQVLVFIFGHGEAESFGVSIGGEGPSDRALQLTKKKLHEAIYPGVDLTLVMTSCFSGGWLVKPYTDSFLSVVKRLNVSDMTAAGDEQESRAWASSASCGRAGGSIYAAAVLNALVQPAEIHREGVDESEAMSCLTYINLCCAVHQAYKESDPFYGIHGVSFAARDDMWESEWRTRSGFPLLDYQKKWEELRQVSPGQSAFDSVPTLGFAGSIGRGRKQGPMRTHSPALITWRQIYHSTIRSLTTQYTTFLELAFPDAASFDVEKWALQADNQRLELFRKIKRYNLNQKIFDKPIGDQGWRYPKPDQYLAIALIESSLRYEDICERIDQIKTVKLGAQRFLAKMPIAEKIMGNQKVMKKQDKFAKTVTMKVDGQKRLAQKHPFPED